MKRLLRFWVWLHQESHPLPNLVLTAGFHTLLTALTEEVGMHGHAAFMYIAKEGGPLAGYAIDRKDRWQPSGAEKKRGYTKGWKVADSVADVLGPIVVFLRYHFGLV